MGKVSAIFEAIDQVNKQDPNMDLDDNGDSVPKELIYGLRMTEMLAAYEPDASDELQIASRGQHIKRWVIPREDYPMDRKGYLKWRTQLKLMHGEILQEIMINTSYSAESASEVVSLVTKKKLKNDPESQKLEDVVCLVFLKYYFLDFAAKHEESKVIDILQKTWKKMSTKGQEMALQLPLSEEALAIIQKALK